MAGRPSQLIFFLPDAFNSLFFVCRVTWMRGQGRLTQRQSISKEKKEKKYFSSRIWKAYSSAQQRYDEMVAKYFLFFAVITYTDGPKGNTHWAAVRAEQVNILFFSFPLSHGERALLHEKSQKRRWVSSSSAGPPPPSQGGMYICFFFLFNSAMAPNASQFRRAEINWTARESDWRISFVHLA